MNTNNAVEPERDVIRVPTWMAVTASDKPMNTNEAVEPNMNVIHVPTWVTVVASALVLTAAFAVYCYITGGSLH